MTSFSNALESRGTFATTLGARILINFRSADEKSCNWRATFLANFFQITKSKITVVAFLHLKCQTKYKTTQLKYFTELLKKPVCAFQTNDNSFGIFTSYLMNLLVNLFVLSILSF